MGFASSEIPDEEYANAPADQTSQPALNSEQEGAQTLTSAEVQPEWSSQQLESFTDWADLCCIHYGVSDHNKNDVIEKSALSTHRLLIALFAKVTAGEVDRANAVVAAFPKSRAYKDQLAPRIQATLLDPKLKFYVKGVTSRIVRHIQLNPAAYGVPREVQETYLHQKPFRLDIGKTCSSFRGEKKRKIDESIEEKEDLYTLTRKLCSTTTEATSELADRVALLRHYMQKWIETPSTAETPRTTWWTFMDSKLEKLWTIRKNETAQQHQNRIQKAFSSAVTADLKEFPPSKQVKRFGRGVRLTQWQLNVGAAVQEMQQGDITNEAGDAADDEATEA
ncbi:hypothetical protein RSOLAG22IIIB_14056 [Rhizoctonia solani]|uniref:Uncharacterized protein n=1 Tax=Rhizoctonia solani TaxID=456999 RepID=A0A0K6FTG1_9AGAM|nr:hypothetical protein RSOLAG22IIIB_14056 [Rhizoctonia solani]